VIDFVRALFEPTSFLIQDFECEGVRSLCISKRDTLEFSLLFCGHLDVVPAEDGSFVPRLEGDRLYGRGSADMKGSCAVMIQLMLDNEHSPSFDSVGLVLTTDEETGGDYGVGHLVALGLKADTVFVPDGGDTLTPCVFEKGDACFQLETTGVTAHGARPWLGENAIEFLFDDLGRLRNRFPPLSPPEVWGTSLNIGVISGGAAANSVPAHAVCEINLRYSAETTADELLKEIKGVVRSSNVTLMNATPAVQVNENSAVYQRFCESLVAQGGSSVGVKEHGACDASYFVESSKDILITKPESSAFHIADEWVSLPSLVNLYRALEDFTESFPVTSSVDSSMSSSGMSSSDAKS
jgi:succinyl-diaminopimelate desuccinylase